MGKKILLAAFAVIATVAILVCVWSWVRIRSSLPQIEGEIALAGLKEAVEVSRDIYGIPHIRAQSEDDLYRALGFVNAQDRLWQMDLFRRLSQGRLAEVLGAELIPLDHRHRVLGFHRLAKELYESADDDSKSVLRAYVDGINQHIGASPDRLPLEFQLLRYKPEPWSPEDVYGVLMWQQWMVTFNWESELALTALVQEIGAEAVLELINMRKVTGPTIIPDSEKQYEPGASHIGSTVLPPEFDYDLIKFRKPQSQPSETKSAWLRAMAEVYASNCWAVDGRRSQSGKPILCNDPHIPHTLPSIWYMAHLSSPGMNDSFGIMTPGVPMVIMGHNERFAWGDTTTGADTQDLYIEKLNPDNPDEYLYRGEYHPFETVTETIRYRERGAMKSVQKEIRFSVHGPIINEIANPPVSSDTPLALRWAGYEVSDSIKSAIIMAKVHDWEGFRNALSYTATPIWNWVYADSQGNIGYQVVGRIPIRKKGLGLFPVPGWLEEYEWNGYIPYDELPRLFNPSTGYVVTANNKVAPDDYPYLISTRFAPGYRAERIQELLLSRDRLSVEDMQRIQMDDYSRLGAHVRDRFVQACEKYPHADPNFDRAVELLRHWDFNTGKDSAAAALFHESYAVAGRRLLSGRVRPELWRQIYRSIGSLEDMLAYGAEEWFDDPRTDAVETSDELLAKSVAEAAGSLQKFFGGEPATWKWGQLHTLTFVHPLGRSGILGKVFNVGPMPVGGGNHTVNPANYYFDSPTMPYAVVAGPSMRTVIDFGNPDSARMVITLGQSGHRFSKHYSDQLPLWLRGEAIPMWKSSEAIEKHLEARLTLKPKSD
jgi:penicillin amidase